MDTPMSEEKRPILLNLDYGNTKTEVYSVLANRGQNRSQLKSSASSTIEDKLQSSRIIDRRSAFHQSRGKMNIRKLIRQRDLTLLYADDLFHTLVDAPTVRMVSLLLAGYISIITLFAIVYFFISEVFHCNLEISNFVEAYFFSIEVMATIGFGTSDIFFDDCIGVAVVLSCQICTKIITDALIIGVIYCRVSRPNKRASTVVFSRNAVMKRIRGRLYFTFRVCELRKHQLVEAHIRCYAIRHERDCDSGEVTPFCSRSMRLNHPNDELGGMLLMCLPQEVVHELDAWSPLMPPPEWGSAAGVYHWDPPAMQHARLPRSGVTGKNAYDPDLYTSYPGIARRSAGEEPGGAFRCRSRAPVPVNLGHTMEGSSAASTPPPLQRQNTYRSRRKRATALSQPKAREADSGASYFEILRALSSANPSPDPFEEEPLLHHTQYRPTSADLRNSRTTSGGNKPFRTTSPMASGRRPFAGADTSSSHEDGAGEEPWEREEKEMVSRFMDDRSIEVVVLVEGQDSATGGVVQARHSYKMNEVEWYTSFMPCVTQDENDGAAIIDYCLFHETEASVAAFYAKHEQEVEVDEETGGMRSYNSFDGAVSVSTLPLQSGIEENDTVVSKAGRVFNWLYRSSTAG